MLRLGDDLRNSDGKRKADQRIEGEMKSGRDSKSLLRRCLRCSCSHAQYNGDTHGRGGKAPWRLAAVAQAPHLAA
jgi:hypothetical protein